MCVLFSARRWEKYFWLLPQFIYFLAKKQRLHIYCKLFFRSTEIKQLRLICVHTKSNTLTKTHCFSSISLGPFEVQLQHGHDLHLKLNPANHVLQRSDKLLGSHSSSHYVNFLPHNRCTTLSAFDTVSNSVRAHRLVAPPAVRSTAHRHFGDSEKSRLCVRNYVDHANNLREEFPGSCTNSNWFQ